MISTSFFIIAQVYSVFDQKCILSVYKKWQPSQRWQGQRRQGQRWQGDNDGKESDNDGKKILTTTANF